MTPTSRQEKWPRRYTFGVRWTYTHAHIKVHTHTPMQMVEVVVQSESDMQACRPDRRPLLGTPQPQVATKQQTAVANVEIVWTVVGVERLVVVLVNSIGCSAQTSHLLQQCLVWAIATCWCELGWCSCINLLNKEFYFPEFVKISPTADIYLGAIRVALACNVNSERFL